MFEFDLHDELKRKLRKLSKKDRALKKAVDKKIEEVISRNTETIEHYKNLHAPLNEFKRVHVGSFVLTFKVYKEKNFVLFRTLRHHDEAYEGRK